MVRDWSNDTEPPGRPRRPEERGPRMVWKLDRRRPIDAVIDYFGEWREDAAPRWRRGHDWGRGGRDLEGAAASPATGVDRLTG